MHVINITPKANDSNALRLIQEPIQKCGLYLLTLVIGMYLSVHNVIMQNVLYCISVSSSNEFVKYFIVTYTDLNFKQSTHSRMWLICKLMIRTNFETFVASLIDRNELSRSSQRFVYSWYWCIKWNHNFLPTQCSWKNIQGRRNNFRWNVSPPSNQERYGIVVIM